MSGVGIPSCPALFLVSGAMTIRFGRARSPNGYGEKSRSASLRVMDTPCGKNLALKIKADLKTEGVLRKHTA
jgi:hypothetical protein